VNRNICFVRAHTTSSFESDGFFIESAFVSDRVLDTLDARHVAEKDLALLVYGRFGLVR